MCVYDRYRYVLSSQRRKKAITFFVCNNLNMPKTALMIFKENINSWVYVFFFAPPFSSRQLMSLITNSFFFCEKWNWIGIKNLFNSLVIQWKYCVVNLIIHCDIFIIVKLMGIIISLWKSYVVFCCCLVVVELMQTNNVTTL